MDVSRLSNMYTVRRLCDEDVPAVVSLCSGNVLYYSYCPPFVSEQSIKADMRALPPGKTLADKHYVGYYKGARLVAVLDLITAYPNELTAFIGFFMTDPSVQNRGVGSSIIEELCSSLYGMGFRYVRLGRVRGNPQAEHFWHRNGFAETGVTYDTDDYTVIVAQRAL